MALYQRGRIWYADYYADGERVQESTGTANKREAEKFLALRMSEVQRGVFVKPVNYHFGGARRALYRVRQNCINDHGSETYRC